MIPLDLAVGLRVVRQGEDVTCPPHIGPRCVNGFQRVQWSSQLHNYCTISRERGYDSRRNPLNSLVGHVGFEPTTS